MKFPSLQQKSKRKLLALTFGMIVTLLFIALAELIARVYLHYRDSNPVLKHFRYSPEVILEREEKVGEFGILPPTPLDYVEERTETIYQRPFKAALRSYDLSGAYKVIAPMFSRPTGVLQDELRFGDLVVFNSTYNLDEYGRRKTPGEKEKTGVERFLILLGNSNTFGDGLSDDETIAYFLGKQNPSVRVYNYGVAGLYPGEALAWLRAVEGAPEISEKRGTILFFWADYCMQRIMHSFSAIYWALNKGYYYEREDGEILAEKTIRETFPLRSFLSSYYPRCALARVFGLDWPRNPSPKDYGFIVKLISKIKSEGKRLGADQFYVVFYPLFGKKYRDDLVPYFEKAGIRYIDYSELPLWNMVRGRAQIAYDSHLTGEANEAFAREISRLKFLFEDAREPY